MHGSGFKLAYAGFTTHDPRICCQVCIDGAKTFQGKRTGVVQQLKSRWAP